MRLVDDVHLRASLGRGRIHRALAQIPGVIDSAIGGRIDLDDVQRCVPTPNPSARLTFAARLAIVRAIRTIEGHRQDAGEGRLPHAAGPTEEVGVTNPIGRDRAPERLRDVLLSSHFRKGTRPMLTR